MDSVIKQQVFVGTWDQFSLSFYQEAQLYKQEESPLACSPRIQSIDPGQTIVLYVPPLCSGSIFLDDYPELFAGNFLKIIIIVDTQESLILYEHDSDSCFSEQLMHIVLHPGADCVYVHHFAPHHSLKAERATVVTAYEEAFFDYNVFYAGTGSINHFYKSFIRGKRVQAFLHGVYCATKNQRMNLIYSSLHTASLSQSTVFVKGIVADMAQVLYKGSIVIEPSAHTTQASQENGTLILGTKGSVESVPVLEVLNNDVNCSHASAVGRLDEAHILYLKTRGIAIAEAQRMIIHSYLDDVFKNNKSFYLKEKMRLVINLLPLI